MSDIVLNDETKALIKENTDAWVANAIRTDTLDRDEAIAAIKDLYKVCDCPEPEVIIVSSPRQMKFLHMLISYQMNVEKLEITQIIDKYLNAFLAAESPKAFVISVCGEEVLKYKDSWQSKFQGGNTWAFYEAFATSARDVLNVDFPMAEKYRYWERCAKTSGMRVIEDEYCIISDFPCLLKFDDTNRSHRSHCENGPSHKWRDGWELFTWHGTTVPKEWIMNKENIDPMIALTWKNIEQRRCACEIIGWANVIRKLDAKVIDSDDDPEIGTLLEVNVPDIGTEKFLRVLCGTKREFALPVPPDMKTALEAQAWTWNLSTQDFTLPEIRT